VEDIRDPACEQEPESGSKPEPASEPESIVSTQTRLKLAHIDIMASRQTFEFECNKGDRVKEPVLSISTRAIPTPAAVTAFTARVTSCCRNVEGARAMVA
jgi:hypothetical protein